MFLMISDLVYPALSGKNKYGGDKTDQTNGASRDFWSVLL